MDHGCFSQANKQMEVEDLKVKIPNKPFMRAAKYEDLNQILYVRIKLWKIQSCNLKNLTDNSDLLTGLDQENHKRKRTQLYKLLTTSTLKKTFKDLRKISLYGERSILKFFSKTWRLKKLGISFSDAKFPIQHFIKHNLDPKLQVFAMEYWKNPDSLSALDNKCLIESIYGLTSLKECSLAFPHTNKGQVANYKLYRFGKLKKLTIGNESAYSFLAPKALTQLKSLETIILPTTSGDEFQNIFSYFGDLKNLRVLSLHLRGTFKSTIDDCLSFLMNCKRLESLSLFVERLKNYSLDFLLHLEDLKELSFEEIGAIEKIFELRKFPKIHSLVKITLSLRNTKYCLNSIQEMLKENKNLKELNLDIPIQELVDVVSENLKLPIEVLSLQLPKSKMNIEYLLSKLFNFIERHDQLKRMSFKTQGHEPIITQEMIKALSKLTLLEELELKFPQVFEQKKSQTETQSTLLSFSNLKTLVIDSKKIKLSAIEFKHLGENLLKFKKLERFVIEVNLDQISLNDYEKFIKLTRVAKKEKNLTIILHGYSNSKDYENKYANSRSSIWRIRYQYE